MNDLENISVSFSTFSDNNLISLLLYGDGKFDDTENRKIIMSTIRFIKDSLRFDEKLFSRFFLTLNVPIPNKVKKIS